MNNIKFTVSFCCMIVVLLLIIYFWLRNARTFINGPDGRTYGIIERNDPVKNKEVLYRLSEINARVNKLCNYCVEYKYPDYTRAQRMKKRWDKCSIKETSPKDTSIAYVINKGTEFNICLINKDSGELEDINSTMFVVLHELGHMMSVSWGHNDEFWSNFKLLISQSHKIGIYNYDNYNDKPREYCGISIYSNPCPNATCKN